MLILSQLNGSHRVKMAYFHHVMGSARAYRWLYFMHMVALKNRTRGSIGEYYSKGVRIETLPLKDNGTAKKQPTRRWPWVLNCYAVTSEPFLNLNVIVLS